MRNLFIILIALFLVACGSGIPSIKPYKLDIQQGNVVTSKMLLKLKPGMTKSQVRYILGTPLIQDSFHGDRWDYFYQMRKAGKLVEQRRVYLTFVDEALSKVSGDVAAKQDDSAVNSDAPKGARVVVPTVKPEKKGFFERLKFWGEDDAAKEANASEEAMQTTVEQAVADPAVEVPKVEMSTAEGITIEEIKDPEVPVPATNTEATETKKKGFFDKLKFWD